MKIYHYTSKTNLENILVDGLKASSKYEALTELRKGVVFCWLSPDDQKIFNNDEICLEITIDDSLCTVAEMDYISFAMMYKYGGEKYGGKNIPINHKASDLFVQLYETTALPISDYNDNFFTPEVLVKGSVNPQNIKVYEMSK